MVSWCQGLSLAAVFVFVLCLLPNNTASRNREAFLSHSPGEKFQVPLEHHNDSDRERVSSADGNPHLSDSTRRNHDGSEDHLDRTHGSHRASVGVHHGSPPRWAAKAGKYLDVLWNVNFPIESRLFSWMWGNQLNEDPPELNKSDYTMLIVDEVISDEVNEVDWASADDAEEKQLLVRAAIERVQHSFEWLFTSLLHGSLDGKDLYLNDGTVKVNLAASADNSDFVHVPFVNKAFEHHHSVGKDVATDIKANFLDAVRRIGAMPDNPCHGCNIILSAGSGRIKKTAYLQEFEPIIVGPDARNSTRKAARNPFVEIPYPVPSQFYDPEWRFKNLLFSDPVRYGSSEQALHELLRPSSASLPIYSSAEDRVFTEYSLSTVAMPAVVSEAYQQREQEGAELLEKQRANADEARRDIFVHFRFGDGDWHSHPKAYELRRDLVKHYKTDPSVDNVLTTGTDTGTGTGTRTGTGTDTGTSGQFSINDSRAAAHRHATAGRGSGVRGKPRVLFADVGLDSEEDYFEEVFRGRYCLCPKGHTPASQRIYEVSLLGCIPVIISDPYMPPFPDLAPPGSWYVHLMEKDWNRTVELLSTIPLEQERMMRRQLARVWNILSYPDPPRRGDAFHLSVARAMAASEHSKRLFDAGSLLSKEEIKTKEKGEGYAR